MPARSVNLTHELESFIKARVESGWYESASEVVCAALRTLENEEHHFEEKLADLRNAIDEGDASGVAAPNAFGRIRATIKNKDLVRD